MNLTTAKVKLLSKRKERLHFRSLYLFSTTNRFRKYTYTIVNSTPFEYFILLTVITSCILLVAQGPNHSTTNLNDPYIISNLVLNGIFAVEAILKIIAYGFVLHRDAYLRSSWNVFDFIVVVSGM